MILPPLLVLTDRRQARRPLPEVVRAAVDGGATAVVLREKDLGRDERARLAAALADVLRPVGGLLLVASDPTIPGDGVHLAASDPLPGPGGRPVGRSCHDRAGVAAAAAEGCAWATLSPIFPSPSKPGYGPALGPEVFAGCPLPVYALGGVTAHNAASCTAHGAAGVAVMGAVMAAADPAAAVASLLHALGAEARS